MMGHWVVAAMSAWTLVTGGDAAAAVLAPQAQASSAPVRASRVLVMPFENPAPEPRSYWLGEGSAVILADSLRALGVPAMRRDERLRAFELLRVPAVAGLSRATIIRVGQVVEASQVIIGTVTLAGDALTIRASAIDPVSGQVGSPMQETGPLAEIFDIYDRLAVRLAPGGSATPEQLDDSHPPIAAFEQFIKGLLAEAPASKLSFLNEALRLAPALHRTRLAVWAVHNDLGEHDRALAAVRPVPDTHRLGRQARFLASVSLLELKRYQEAFDELTKLNQEARDATLLNNLGVILLRRPSGTAGARAVSYFNEAVSLEGVDSYFNLGYAYWLDGDASAAALWLREAVRRNPADHAAHYVLGVALEAMGSATEGARERELARQLSSVYAEWEAKSPSGTTPPGLERVRVDLGETDVLRVESAIEAAGQRDQRQLAAFYLEAGRRAYEGERDAEAIRELRRAVYLSPYDDEAHLLLGQVYLRGGRLSDAIDALKISLWSRDTVAARLVLADAYELAGMADEARTEWRTILAHDPSHAEAKKRLEDLSDR